MKKRFAAFLLLACSAGLLTQPSRAGVAYPDPTGGWKYIFHGDKDAAGEPNSGFTSLDGTWSHDNGSDEFDGSKLGGNLVADAFGVGNAPGGVMSITESGITYLRLQDPGNPTGYNFANPSNRKVYFGHDITAEGASDTLIDDGVTLSFRIRIPTPKKTTAPIDSLYRDGQSAAGVKPYPDTGDGYLISDGGKGNIGIKQASGGIISFALTTAADTFGGDPAGTKAGFTGLSMNKLNGATASAAVDFDDPGTFIGMALDPTEWHEFWVVLRKDPNGVGTHQAFIFADGSKEPSVFSLTAGDGNDFSGVSYLAIGGSRTAENWALDVDFVAFKSGVEFPAGALTQPFASAFAASPTGFRLDVSDAVAGTKVNSSSVVVTLDGQTVTPKVAKQDATTTITYDSPTIFAAGSSHTVNVTFTDTGTPPASLNVERKFTVENYPVIAANTAVDDTKVNRTKKGFKLRPFGTEENNPNTTVWTEDALAAKHGDNLADLTGADANGFYIVEDVINFDIGAGAGNFTDANGKADKPFPGFPGSQTRDGGTGNAIEEILTLVEFPSAGFYRMGVSSDDGFKVSTASPDPRPPKPAVTLGEFSGGRGTADSIFGFKVDAPGIYPVRLIWENGSGGATLEWFTVQSDGRKVLVNDTAAGALKAYQFEVLPLKPAATKPTIALARDATGLKITFTGTLQSADTVTGPWTDVPNASGSITVSSTAGNKFYRAKQ